MTRGGRIDERIFPDFFRSFAADFPVHTATALLTETLLATAPAPVPLTAAGHTFRMVPVRGGEFDMGDEHGDLWDACRPVHPVRLGDFCIGQFPVTQALWRAVADSPDPEPRRGSKPRRGLLAGRDERFYSPARRKTS